VIGQRSRRPRGCCARKHAHAAVKKKAVSLVAVFYFFRYFFKAVSDCQHILLEYCRIIKLLGGAGTKCDQMFYMS
jgi:hypothetical protein